MLKIKQKKTKISENNQNMEFIKTNKWERAQRMVPGMNTNKANTKSRVERKKSYITDSSIILRLAKTNSLEYAISIADGLDNCRSFSRNAKFDGKCVFYRNLKFMSFEDLFVYKKNIGWILFNQRKAMGIPLIDKDNVSLLFDNNIDASHQFSKSVMIETHQGEIDFLAALTIDDILGYHPKKKITNKILLKIYNEKLCEYDIRKNLIWSYYRLNTHDKMMRYLRENREHYDNYLFLCAGYYSKEVSDIQIGITGSIDKKDLDNLFEENSKYKKCFLNTVIREIKEEIGLDTCSCELIHHIESEVFFFKKDKSIFKEYLEHLLLNHSTELEHSPGIV
jgi:hypothetical protein